MGREPVVKGIALLGLILVSSVGIVGCGSEEAKMTKDEQENFKGGPMPAGFLDKNGGAPPKKGP